MIRHSLEFVIGIVLGYLGGTVIWRLKTRREREREEMRRLFR